ncbi:MAG: methyltransferase, FkbM family [Verrucomicrobiaceae bacterium]|nr:methyltransferase, FkbM family [Verrucomicrobiaceae bacterium]
MPHTSSFLGRLALRFISRPLARWKQSRLPDDDVIIKLCGFTMRIFSPRSNRIGTALYLQGIWEPEVTGAFRALIKPGDTVFDIGGDAGYYTLLFSKCAGEKGRVVVFEPIPKAQERIKENIALNGFSNCTLVTEALGSKSGSFVLERPFEDSRINLTKSAAGEGDITVQVERFDTLAERLSLPVPDLVKIDVEGAELEVLRGMEGLVADHHPAFVIELHPQFLPQFNATVDDVLGWLRQRGYHLTALDAGEISTSEATTFLAQVLK